jgi:hypothetical protein
MAELRVTELDFVGIKQNLKEYLASQDEFSDYNFEGSAMSVLLDILAYNTHYNATLAHLLANEMFIDSALKRSSVVSIAKSMGYVPNSQHSARATVDIEITAPAGYSGTTLTLGKDSTLTSTGLATAESPAGVYNFHPDKDYVVPVADQVGNIKTFVFTDVTLIEGARVSNTFIVDSTNLSGPFTIPNKNVDTTTLTVRVQTSSTELTTTNYIYSDTVIDIDGNSNVFWVEEGPDGLFQLVFGDNIIGKQLSYGNIITVEYFVGAGEGGNNLSNFNLVNSLIGPSETKVVTTVNRSYGGSAIESIDSIKFNAPKFNTSRNRAVTSDDYKSLISRNFPGINSISVWGGEQNDPPIYGKVFICLDPLEGTIITDQDKDNIARDIIAPRSVVSVQPEFVDPEYTYIGIDSSVKFDQKKSIETSTQLEARLRQIVNDYFQTNLNKLAKDFYYSQLSSDIMTASSALISNSIDITLHKRFSGLISDSVAFKLTPNFGQPILPNSVRSTNFTTFFNSAYYDVYMIDVPDTNPPDNIGTGTIHLIELSTGNIVSSNFGTVDYSTGKITVPSCYFIALLGGTSSFRIYVKPQNVTSDITTKIINTYPGTVMESSGPIIPVASRNALLKLDTSGANAAANIPTGLTITALPV